MLFRSDASAFSGDFSPADGVTYWTGPKSLSTHEVIGYTLTSVKYTQQEIDGELVDVPEPSRESVYMADIYFSNVPGAPRDHAEAPGYDAADVVSVFSDGYTPAQTGTSYGTGALTTVGGENVLRYQDVALAKLTNATGFTVPANSNAEIPSTLHVDVWVSEVDQIGRAHV